MKRNRNEKIAVLGVGMEGKDVVAYLLKHGYFDIAVFDKKEKEGLDTAGFDSSKVKFITGADYPKNGLCEYKTIFRSPGVYRYIPEIVEAEKPGSEITSNIKLFFDEFKGTTIGVTGTKGKGTTSTLIYEILKHASHFVPRYGTTRDKQNDKRKKVFLAGNIGSPPLSILARTDENSIAVLELSSFQLMDIHKSPNIAVVLNITSDHMDWHKNQSEYLNAKKNNAKYQNNNDFKVINYDYETSRSFAGLSSSRNYYFSKEKEVRGVYVKDGVIISNISGKDDEVGRTNQLFLRGVHNWENVCAAICASQLAGADIKTIKKVVFSFKGLEHRLELVGEICGVKYYNDSFSTNPQTTIAAVDSFSEPITLILGGYDKGLDFEGMVKHLCRKKNLENIILIGDVELKLLKLLKKLKYKNSIFPMGKPKMSAIVAKCKEITKEGGVVLLSPACASFDMFENYKERGNEFSKAVEKLR